MLLPSNLNGFLRNYLDGICLFLLYSKYNVDREILPTAFVKLPASNEPVREWQKN